MHKVLSSITYRIIKGYRDRYIMPPVNADCIEKESIQNPNIAAKIIIDAINSSKPCMISRFGFVELEAALSYRKSAPFSFMRNLYPFWIGQGTKNKMLTNAGFFPTSNNALSHFSDLMFSIAPEIDILTTFRPEEDLMPNVHCIKIRAPYLEPFWSDTPWTSSLKDKNILVVHPFAESVKKQYEKRELLFEKNDILPEFNSLNIIKAVQSLGGKCNEFTSWFDALHYMEDEIDKVDYDVALIGCGAYGMPLAAHCKKMGKKAVHLGGSLQLLFGIRGNRWETEQDIYMQFMNEHWVRPLECEKPAGAQNVENACYW